MAINFAHINTIENPSGTQVKDDYIQFLSSLNAPTIIDITGEDTTRCRVITTLLHGNEPSGLIALHRWLTSKSESFKPETNLRFIICSVEAASTTPLFSHRYLENGVDINRCFGHNQNTHYYLRANVIAKAINDVNPEIVIDLHNTSGAGPAFGVCTTIDSLGLSLVSLFCQSVILSGIKLGALMEQDFGCPVVTIECGGAQDIHAHQVAFHGIEQLANINNIRENNHHGVNVICNPLRLKLAKQVELSYHEQNENFQGVTLISTIEQLNFNGAEKGQTIGWVDERKLENLTLIDDTKINVIDQYFYVENSQIICKKNIDIFMATAKKSIAMTDCLFYIVSS